MSFPAQIWNALLMRPVQMSESFTLSPQPPQSLQRAMAKWVLLRLAVHSPSMGVLDFTRSPPRPSGCAFQPHCLPGSSLTPRYHWSLESLNSWPHFDTEAERKQQLKPKPGSLSDRLLLVCFVHLFCFFMATLTRKLETDGSWEKEEQGKHEGTATVSWSPDRRPMVLAFPDSKPTFVL